MLQLIPHISSCCTACTGTCATRQSSHNSWASEARSCFYITYLWLWLCCCLLYQLQAALSVWYTLMPSEAKHLHHHNQRMLAGNASFCLSPLGIFELTACLSFIAGCSLSAAEQSDSTQASCVQFPFFHRHPLSFTGSLLSIRMHLLQERNCSFSACILTLQRHTCRRNADPVPKRVSLTTGCGFQQRAQEKSSLSRLQADTTSDFRRIAQLQVDPVHDMYLCLAGKACCMCCLLYRSPARISLRLQPVEPHSSNTWPVANVGHEETHW